MKKCRLTTFGSEATPKQTNGHNLGNTVAIQTYSFCFLMFTYWQKTPSIKKIFYSAFDVEYPIQT